MSMVADIVDGYCCLMMSRDPGSAVVMNDNRQHLHQMGPVQPIGASEVYSK